MHCVEESRRNWQEPKEQDGKAEGDVLTALNLSAVLPQSLFLEKKTQVRSVLREETILSDLIPFFSAPSLIYSCLPVVGAD